MKSLLAPERIGWSLGFMTRLWSMSLRYRRIGYEAVLDAQKGGKRLVYAVWHNELFPLGYLHRGERVVAVVSQSRDGEYVARVLSHFGFLLARGSSSRGGVRALIQAQKTMMARKSNAVFSVDGPRGPRHKVKDGALYLASRADAWLVPVRVRMHRKKVFAGSWDRFELPFPFSACTVVYGTPYSPGKELKGEKLAEQRRYLETTMNRLLDDHE